MEAFILELILGLSLGLIGSVATLATFWLKQKINKGNLQTLLVDAIAFAEEKAKQEAKKKVDGVELTPKMELAKKYIGDVDPKVAKKYGGILQELIESKLAQLIRVGASNTMVVK